MPFIWKVSRSKDTSATSARGPVSWIVLIAGVAIAAVGAIGLWGELNITFGGVSTTAKVIETHHATASGRMASIVAQVEVAVPGGRPVRTEVEDSFGVAEWIDGGTVKVICARLATDYPHCELDSMLDRWLTPLVFLVVGLGVVWGWRRSRRPQNT